MKRPAQTMKRNALLAASLLLLTVALRAQTLDWPALRTQVLKHHPLAQQADLAPDQAAAALLRARGGFDPKAYTDYTAKNFKSKNYFQYTEAGIKWPTLLGLEFKGAYNYATGAYLNPETALPTDGQATFGLNWTLGQGLFIDERRAALKQAQIGLRQSEAERAALLNDLLLDAAKAYWTWVAADNTLKILGDALQQAEQRNTAIRESFLQGERSAMDTMEAFIQVQNRRLDVNFAQTELQNATLALRFFLWTENNEPLAPELLLPAPSLLPGTFTPLSSQNAADLLQQARLQHPELRIYEAKLGSLHVERRLKNEKRKPVLDLSYYLLGEGWQFFPTSDANNGAVLGNDIKWGLNFSYPLLNRKARGDLQVTDIKITQTDLELRQKRLAIQNKVQQYANEQANLGVQANLYRDITVNYRTLLDAENERFRFGESSVFLVNTREQRWLDAQIKYLKLLSEYRKAEAGLLWSAGTLAN